MNVNLPNERENDVAHPRANFVFPFFDVVAEIIKYNQVPDGEAGLLVVLIAIPRSMSQQGVRLSSACPALPKEQGKRQFKNNAHLPPINGSRREDTAASGDAAAIHFDCNCIALVGW